MKWFNNFAAIGTLQKILARKYENVLYIHNKTDTLCTVK